MNELEFPAECRGCSESCYRCARRRGEYRLADLRQLLAQWVLKRRALLRLTKELEDIEGRLTAMGVCPLSRRSGADGMEVPQGAAAQNS